MNTIHDNKGMSETSTNEPQYMNAISLASRLNVSRSLVSKWMDEGCPFINVGGTNKKTCPRFKIDEVEAWLKNRQVKGDA